MRAASRSRDEGKPNSPQRKGRNIMSFYRCYHVGADGNTLGVQNFMASGDVDAQFQADAIKASRKWPGIEMWEAHRKVSCQGIQFIAR